MCRNDERFNVYRFFDLLLWLHGDMKATQSRLRQLQDDAAVPAGSAPASSADGPSSGRLLRRAQQHLYHCRALAERAVACVASCLHDVHAHLLARKRDGRVTDADRTMVHTLLQRTSTVAVRSCACMHPPACCVLAMLLLS